MDVHCHCLPGLDDGPQTAEAALALCRALVADGVTAVCATPQAREQNLLLRVTFSHCGHGWGGYFVLMLRVWLDAPTLDRGAQSPLRESNSRPSAYHADALPLG